MNWKIVLFTASAAVMLCLGCTPDEQLNGIPSVDEFALREASNSPSYPCGLPELYALTEVNGNHYVDDCGLIPCANNTIPWGEISLATYEGLSNKFLRVEGKATSGWTFTEYDIFASDLQSPAFGANGVPVVDGNWTHREISDFDNEFLEDIPIQPASFSAYEVSVRVSMYRLDFFGGYDANTNRNLWIAYKPNTVNSRTQFVVGYTPPACSGSGNKIALVQ